MVGLSAAAILSVYAVGYFNTADAENGLALLPDTGAVVQASGGTSLAAPSTGSSTSSSNGSSSSATGSSTSKKHDSSDDNDGEENDDGGSSSQQAPAATPTAAPSASRSGSATTGTTSGGAAATSAYRDGTYTAVGTSRHGDIQATVVISGGKIVSAQVSACNTRYPCSRVNPLVSEVVSRQAAPVNHVSGATDSSRAYTAAVTAALAQARAV
jgi:uncharacterized protein with FMN-binding domain